MTGAFSRWTGSRPIPAPRGVANADNVRSHRSKEALVLGSQIVDLHTSRGGLLDHVIRDHRGDGVGSGVNQQGPSSVWPGTLRLASSFPRQRGAGLPGAGGFARRPWCARPGSAERQMACWCRLVSRGSPGTDDPHDSLGRGVVRQGATGSGC